jgi:hypothetical protein
MEVGRDLVVIGLRCGGLGRKEGGKDRGHG